MKKVILEKICEKSIHELPIDFKHLDIADFGLNTKLYKYQQKAIVNLLHCLNIYYSQNQPDKQSLFDQYQINGLDGDLENNLNINIEDDNFDFLSTFYNASDNKIEFKEIINRAGCWMATGSGKTLVMVKLIDILFKLVKQRVIPQKDILFLAPKDRILSQIQEHIELFNQNGKLQIEFRDIREWEKIKHNQGNLFEENLITVFYYRADNITDQDKEKQIDFKTYLNNGNWYLILDEAHKGHSEFSKRQQYYTALSQNGFLFNFSATFTVSEMKAFCK
ncbi:DEAD/DEAH box helicase family protein [Candidatus Neomarinimicrobiota bacterium]